MSGRRVLLVAVVAAFLAVLWAPGASALDKGPIYDDHDGLGGGPGDPDWGDPDNPFVDCVSNRAEQLHRDAEAPVDRQVWEHHWVVQLMRVLMGALRLF